MIWPPTLADRANEKRQHQYACPGMLSLFFFVRLRVAPLLTSDYVVHCLFNRFAYVLSLSLSRISVGQGYGRQRWQTGRTKKDNNGMLAQACCRCFFSSACVWLLPPYPALSRLMPAYPALSRLIPPYPGERVCRNAIVPTLNP